MKGILFVGIDISPGRYRCDNTGRQSWGVWTGPYGNLYDARGAAGKDGKRQWGKIDIGHTDFAFETWVKGNWIRIGDSTRDRGRGRGILRPVADPDLLSELKNFSKRPDMLRDLARQEPSLLLAHRDFDNESGELLSRVQRAVDAVLRSTVNRDGLLDSVNNAVTLPRQMWEIAQVLAWQTRLRTEQAELVANSSDVEIEAAIHPLRQKLALSIQSVTRRVEGLERYADHVQAADMASNALDLISARAHEYDELLAETARDDLAIPEMERLAQEGASLARTLQEHLRTVQESGKPPESK